MVKSTGEARVGMMIDLANHIIVEGAISAEWKLSSIVNCYKGKGDASETEIYRTEINNTNSGDSTNSTKIGRTIEKLTTNAIVILRQLVETGERLAQKKNLYFAFVDMEKVFHRVFWDVV